jgi:hypothetical protein
VVYPPASLQSSLELARKLAQIVEQTAGPTPLFGAELGGELAAPAGHLHEVTI